MQNHYFRKLYNKDIPDDAYLLFNGHRQGHFSNKRRFSEMGGQLTIMKRQTVRKALLLISLLLFPVTMWYFSPYLIIQAASEHIMNGSFIVFCLMFVCSMFLGRVWCGYLCPAGGLQECALSVNNKSSKQGWRNYIKFVIWIIWIAAVVVTFVLGKNKVTINFLYMTDHGISIAEIYNYIIYYGVSLLSREKSNA